MLRTTFKSTVGKLILELEHNEHLQAKDDNEIKIK